MSHYDQPEESDQLTPREEKVLHLHQQGKDPYCLARQFGVPVALMAQWLMEIQRKLEKKEA
jgi:DNA-binding NarL/FixJ family response regulator